MLLSKFKRIKALHNLVIHKHEGNTFAYTQETRDIAKIKYDDPVLLKICRKCFKKAT
jgi:hypothetical protein